MEALTKIQQKVREILKKHQTADLMKIAECEGIKIMEDPFTLPEGLFLGIACVRKGYRTIGIQPTLDKAKYQIALGRAIGLHVLYLTSEDAIVPVFDQLIDEQQEDIAAFASALTEHARVSA